MTDNYFAVGLALLDDLKQHADCWGIKTIDHVAAIAKINKTITPAIYIVNTSNNVADTVRAIDSQEVQTWTIVIAVSHAASQTDTTDLMQSAGELIGCIVKHVQGFKIDDYHTPLQRTRTVGQPTYFSTFGLYPFTFETKFTI